MNPEAKPRILFVDDEANALKGLERMLHASRSEWDIVFVCGGAKALTVLESSHFDIVVSDLRMPEVDGFAVLNAVRQRSPETVRIALSGHADRESTLRAMRQIHQFLAKPCDSETLKLTLRRALRLGEFLAEDRLRRLIAQMSTLPSLSSLYDSVVQELEEFGSSLRSIGETIERDPGMSTKVLQLANCAFFGLPQRVTSPVQATILLGAETLRILVLSVRIFEQFETEAPAGLVVSDVWQHSVLCARLAKRLAVAESASAEVAESAFLAGLLHDVGKLVLATNLPEKYHAVLRLAQGRLEATLALERRIIGATHGEVGAYLMGLWGFQEDVIEAIAWHHAPAEAPTDASAPVDTEASTARLFSPLAAVYIANRLLNEDEDAGEATPPFEPRYLNESEMENRLPLWREMCRQTKEEEEIA